MSLIPAHYFDAVAVLEDSADGGESHFPVATGSVIGIADPDQTGVAEGQTLFDAYLVTNRHVILEQKRLWIRFNQGAGSKRFELAVLTDDGASVFNVSERYDLAVCGLNATALRDEGADFSVLGNGSFLTLDEMKGLGVGGGDDVFVLGFPMGLAGTERKYAIARSGVIARVDREIVDETGSFLIDCAVYPGNSGGPVILRPEPLALEGREPRHKVHVIGIVSGYVPYTDIAISQQSKRPRVTFEENSGLAYVVPIDALLELLRSPTTDTEAEPTNETVEDDEGAADSPESPS